MKKLIALVLCLFMISAVAVSFASAEERKPIDARELEEYGQQHFYLGYLSESDVVPNASDAKIEENEYRLTHEYKYGDKLTVFTDKSASATFMDNEWVKIYISYDERNLYIGAQTKDPNYVKGKDGFSFNLSFRDGGYALDAVSRLCFDLTQHKDAEEDDLTTMNMKCRTFLKNEDGTWKTVAQKDGIEYINDASMHYDPTSKITTLEVAFDMPFLMEFWGNELDLEDVRLYFVPFVWMYGESAKGANDVVLQGILWNYLTGSAVDPEIKQRFNADYPGKYWTAFFPNIVHFRSESGEAPTTTNPITTPNATTTASPTTDVTSAESTTAATTLADDNGGCGGMVAIVAVAVLPMMAAVTFLGRKKEN